MHRITKTFECDYGHRVHNQTLNKEYSIDDQCVCRHLHGHRMKVAISLEAEELTEGMVTDFKHLNWFKKFIDEVIDHKFIVDINDPLFTVITGNSPCQVEQGVHSGATYGYFELDDNELENEFYESFVVVDFVPTSENLSKWFFNIAKTKMAKMGVTVKRVTFNETPKSEAIYEL